MFRPDPDPIKIRIGTYTKNEYGTEIMRKPVPVPYVGWAKKTRQSGEVFFFFFFGLREGFPLYLTFYSITQ